MSYLSETFPNGFVESMKMLMKMWNKCDLESKREVTRENAEQFAKRNNVRLLECSAMENINIDKAFQVLTQDILNKVCPPDKEEVPTKGKKRKNKSVKLKKQNNNQRNSGGCC